MTHPTCDACGESLVYVCRGMRGTVKVYVFECVYCKKIATREDRRE